MTGRGHKGWHGGRGFGRPGGWQQADLPPADDAAGWFAGRLPDEWFTGAPEVTVDRDEILVVGTLEAPEQFLAKVQRHSNTEFHTQQGAGEERQIL